MNEVVVVKHLASRPWTVRLALGVGLLLALLALPRGARADWHPISPPLPDFTGSVSYHISPDSQTVAYIGDIETDDVVELFTVPISETTPTKISPPFVQGGSIVNSRFAFMPDSKSVLYLADQEVDDRVEMYTVPITGGTPLKLNGPLVAGGNVVNFFIDDDSKRVVYLADQQTNEVFELWSVPFGGGTAVKLNQTLVTGGNVINFLVDPLSNRVVYTADAETNGKSELYSVPIAGGAVNKLNPPIILTGGGDSGISNFAVNPSLPVVVFIARETGAQGGNLYSIATAGNPATDLNKLNFNLLATQRLLSFLISPVGDRVVFNVGTRDGSTNAFKGKLYSNLIGGGGAADVSETPDPTFGTDTYQILRNGSRVIYKFQKDAASSEQLVSATLLGDRVPLYAPGPSDEPFGFFRISNDSAWVAFMTSVDGIQYRIKTVPPTGGSATQVGFGSFGQLTPDSGRIVFTRRVDTDGHTELFSVQTFGGGERNLSGLGGDGSAFNPLVSPDSKWVVFTTFDNGRSQVRVSDGGEAQPPITGLAASNDGPKVISAPVAFTTVITGGESISYTWEFGDGATGAGAATTHAYAAGGVYTATVTAVSSANTVTATTTVHIGNAVVEVTNNAYTPANVTILHGGTVVWVLKEGNHSVTADDGSFEQPAGTDWGQFAHTFDHALAAGEAEEEVIAYHCSVHGLSMAGTVTLQGVIAEPGELKVLLPIVGGK